MVLREIIQWCRSQHRVLSITASTGIAGVHIGGSSLHSWAGIAIGLGSAEALVRKICKRQEDARLAAMSNEDWAAREARRVRETSGDVEFYYHAYRNWMTTEVLIIDESKQNNAASSS